MAPPPNKKSKPSPQHERDVTRFESTIKDRDGQIQDLRQHRLKLEKKVTELEKSLGEKDDGGDYEKEVEQLRKEVEGYKTGWVKREEVVEKREHERVVEELKKERVEKEEFEKVQRELNTLKETTVKKEDFDKVAGELESLRLATVNKVEYEKIVSQLNQEKSNNEKLQGIETRFEELKKDTVTASSYKDVCVKYNALVANTVPASQLSNLQSKYDGLVSSSTESLSKLRKERDDLRTAHEDCISAEDLKKLKQEKKDLKATMEDMITEDQWKEKLKRYVFRSEYEALKHDHDALKESSENRRSDWISPVSHQFVKDDLATALNEVEKGKEAMKGLVDKSRVDTIKAELDIEKKKYSGLLVEKDAAVKGRTDAEAATTTAESATIRAKEAQRLAEEKATAAESARTEAVRPKEEAETKLKEAEEKRDEAARLKEDAERKMKVAVKEKDEAVKAMEGAVTSKDDAVEQLKQAVIDMNTAVSSKEEAMRLKGDAEVTMKQAQDERDAAVKRKDEAIKEKEEAVRVREEVLQQIKTAVKDKEQAVKENEEAKTKKDAAEVKSKQAVDDTKAAMRDRENAEKAMNEAVKEKEAALREKESAEGKTRDAEKERQAAEDATKEANEAAKKDREERDVALTAKDKADQEKEQASTRLKDLEQRATNDRQAAEALDKKLADAISDSTQARSKIIELENSAKKCNEELAAILSKERVSSSSLGAAINYLQALSLSLTSDVPKPYPAPPTNADPAIIRCIARLHLRLDRYAKLYHAGAGLNHLSTSVGQVSTADPTVLQIVDFFTSARQNQIDTQMILSQDQEKLNAGTEELRNKLVDCNNEEQRLNELKIALDTLKKQIDNKERSVKDLAEVTCSALNQRIADITKLKDTSDELAQSRKTVVEARDDAIVKLEAASTADLQKIRQLESEARESKDMINKLNQDGQALAREKEGFGDQYRAFLSSFDHVAAHLTKKQILRLSQDVTTANDARNAAERLARQRLTKIGELEVEKTALSSEFDRLKPMEKELANMKVIKSQLDQDLKRVGDENGERKIEIERLKANYQSERESSLKKDGKLSTLEDQLKQSKESSSTSTQQQANFLLTLQSAIDAVKMDQISTIAIDVDAAAATSSSSASLLVTNPAGSTSTDLVLTKAKTLLSNYSSALAQISAAEKEKIGLNSELNSIKNELVQKEKEVQDVRAQVEAGQKELDTKNQNIEELKVVEDRFLILSRGKDSAGKPVVPWEDYVRLLNQLGTNAGTATAVAPLVPLSTAALKGQDLSAVGGVKIAVPRITFDLDLPYIPPSFPSKSWDSLVATVAEPLPTPLKLVHLLNRIKDVVHLLIISNLSHIRRLDTSKRDQIVRGLSSLTNKVDEMLRMETSQVIRGAGAANVTTKKLVSLIGMLELVSAAHRAISEAQNASITEARDKIKALKEKVDSQAVDEDIARSVITADMTISDLEMGQG